MGQLDQKVALVTGSDSGIGRAIAIRFAQEGAAVMVNYAHARDKAEQVRQIIKQNHGKVQVIQADVSQYQQVMNLVQQTVEQFGRLDIMVNNAGMEIHARPGSRLEDRQSGGPDCGNSARTQSAR